MLEGLDTLKTVRRIGDNPFISVDWFLQLTFAPVCAGVWCKALKLTSWCQFFNALIVLLTMNYIITLSEKLWTTTRSWVDLHTTICRLQIFRNVCLYKYLNFTDFFRGDFSIRIYCKKCACACMTKHNESFLLILFIRKPFLKTSRLLGPSWN